MHIDARQLDDNTLIQGDICIIGAGAAGISIAMQLVNTGYKIILLEGGGFEYDDRNQNLFAGKTIGHPYYPNRSSRLHYFGGATMHWGGMCSMFDKIDFEKRDWVANSGWPISLDDIEPYYPAAHDILDLGAFEWNENYFLENNSNLKRLPINEKAIWNKIWHFSPPTRFGTKYRKDIIEATNVHLYTYAHVTDITATENVNAITQVTVKNYAGKSHTVKAKYFVLASCAIQNSRLLLANNKQAPKGIGNDNDLVGRYFMEHPEIKSGELWLNEISPLRFYEQGNNKIRAELAMTADKQQALKVLNATISLMPLELSRKSLPAVTVYQQQDPRKAMDTLGKYSTLDKRNFLQRMFAKSMFGSYGLFTRTEQEPNPNSRVILNATEKDELGMPQADLDWRLSSIDKKTVYEFNKLVGEEVGRAGIGRVKLKDWLVDESVKLLPQDASGGWHHMGTTRMSTDPKTGVVDANCKVHGIENLFVAGSSCFTTGGAVNPTLTIVALSLRLAAHVKMQIANASMV
jgi:choline dehydrogenase-like flavoprotein